MIPSPAGGPLSLPPAGEAAGGDAGSIVLGLPVRAVAEVVVADVAVAIGDYLACQ